MEAALLKDLSDLVGRLPSDHTDLAALNSANDVLGKLAVRANIKSVAPRLGATQLPELLTQLLIARPAVSHLDNGGEAAFMSLLENIGAVVQPLLEVPENLPRLRSAGFGRRAMGILVTTAGALGEEEWYKSVFMFANIAAMLLALVLARDEVTNRELASGANITALLTLASTARHAGQWEAGEDWELSEVRARIAQYLWQITATLCEYANAKLGPSAVGKVYRGFRFFNRGINLARPVALDKMTAQQRNFALGQELGIIVQAAAILMPFCAAQPPRLNANIMDVQGAVLPYVVFIETIGAPTWVDQSGFTGQTRAGIKQALDSAFNAAVSVVLTLLGLNRGKVSEWLQPRILAWIKSSDTRLRDVGIGALANSIASDESSASMLAPPSDLGAALVNLLSSHPNFDTSHSVLALIRNLSNAEVNRARLGAPVLDAVLNLRVWNDVTPKMEAQQRNAMVIVQNLSQIPELAARFMSHADSLQDLIKLSQTSKTVSLRALVLVTFSQAIIHLGTAAEHPMAWEYAGTEMVLLHVAVSLVRGDQDTHILGMGLKACRAVAERGTPTAVSTLIEMLKMEFPHANGATRTGLKSLACILAPPASDAPVRDAEIEADALAFVQAVKEKDGAIPAAVRILVAKNKSEGRMVVAGAESV